MSGDECMILKDVFENVSAASVNQRSQKKKKHMQKIEKLTEDIFDIECISGSNSVAISHCNYHHDKESRMKPTHKSLNGRYIVRHKHAHRHNNIDDDSCESIVSERSFKKKKNKHRTINDNVCIFVNNAQNIQQHDLSVNEDSCKEKHTAKNFTNSHLSKDVFENVSAVSINARSQKKKKHKMQKIENATEDNYDIECISESNSASISHCNYNQDKGSRTTFTDNYINGRYTVGHEHAHHDNSVDEGNCESIISERNFKKKKHRHKTITDNVCIFVNEAQSVQQHDLSVNQDSCKEKHTAENITNSHFFKDVFENVSAVSVNQGGQKKKKHKKQKIENVTEDNFDGECISESNSVSISHCSYNQDKESHMTSTDNNINRRYIVGHEQNAFHSNNMNENNSESIISEINVKKKKHKHKTVNDTESVQQHDLSLHQKSCKEKHTVQNITNSHLSNDVFENASSASVNQGSQKEKKHKKRKIENLTEDNFDIECISESNTVSVSHCNYNQGKGSRMKSTDKNINGRYTADHEHAQHDNSIDEGNCESIISERNFKKEKHRHKTITDNVCIFVNDAKFVQQHDLSLNQDSCKETHTAKNITNSYFSKDVFENVSAASVNQGSQKKKKHKKKKIENVTEDDFDIECISESNRTSISRYNSNQGKESHMMSTDKNINRRYIVGHENAFHNNNMNENNFESIFSERNFKKKKRKHKTVNDNMCTFVINAESMQQPDLSLHQNNCKEKHTVQNITNSHLSNDVFENASTSSVNQESQKKMKHKKQKIENLTEDNFDVECVFESNSDSISHCNYNYDKENHMNSTHKNINGRYTVGHEHAHHHNNNIDGGNCESIISERNFKKKKRKHKTINDNVCIFVNSAQSMQQHNLSVNQDSCKEKHTAENITNSHFSKDVFENVSAVSVDQGSQKKKKHKKRKIENVTEQNFDIECISESNSISISHCNYNQDEETHMTSTDKNINSRYIVGHENVFHSNNMDENNSESIISERNFKKKKHKHKTVNDNACTFVINAESMQQPDLSVNQDSCIEKHAAENITNSHLSKDVSGNVSAACVNQESQKKKKHKKQKIENVNEYNFDEEDMSVINKEFVNFKSNITFQLDESSELICNVDLCKKKGEKAICDVRQINDTLESPYISTMKTSELTNNFNIPSQNLKKKKNQESFNRVTSAMVTSDINVQESLKTAIQDTTLYHKSRRNDFVTFVSKLDFIEDPCDFEIPPVHISETISPLTESKKHCLKSEGVSIKTGKFTRVEDSIILKNFNEFVQKYRVSDPLELFGIGRYGKDYNLLQFIKAKHFYAKLGKGLSDRTLHSIYKRARLLLHPSRNSRKVDVDDVKAVKQLQSQIGKKWNLIGDALQKSGENCLQIYRWHENNISKGKWTTEEEKSLIEAIKKVSGSSNISCDYIKSISWEKVAAHVPTRNFSQCRMYWAIHLAWKENSLKRMWDKECSRKLLHILNKDWSVEDASMIDWEKIHECFEDVAPSPIFLQKRWLYLKSQIPGHKYITYKDIIKKLYMKYYLDSYDMHK